MEDKKIKILHFTLSFCVLLFVFCVFAKTANAAVLSFSPSSGSYEISKNFSVNVFVSSADEAINAASGVVSFPKDKLEVISLSKSGSIFSLWVQEPSFSNSLGTVNFEGIVLNPGFTGSSGKIINIVFKAKKTGDATLFFSSGAVLANDGQGTDVLSDLKSAEFSLKKAVAPPPKPVALPSAPIISSDTHPDSTGWYPISEAQFNWEEPKDIINLRLLLDREPETAPIITYTPAINSKTLENLEDGIWYFHIRFKNKDGWGPVAHYKFQIDTKKPSRFDLKEIKREDPTEPKVKFIFEADDELSGIDYYEIIIDDQNPEAWRKDKADYYETPELEAGKHILIAKAVDKAGNYLENSAEFIVVPSAPPMLFPLPISWIVVIIGIIIIILLSSIVLFIVILRKIVKQQKTFQREIKTLKTS